MIADKAKGLHIRVLVVDDEHVIADTLSTILSCQGYETRTAYTGEEPAVFDPTFCSVT